MKTTQEGHAGRYDKIAERLVLDLKASAVVLVVVDGRHGHGMSVSIDPKGGDLQVSRAVLGEILRKVADQIDAGVGPEGVRYTVTDEFEA